jgi:hypothetical protein
MTRTSVATAATLAAATLAAAQDKPAAALTPLKVQVVLTRQQGEKTVGRLPYSLLCTAGETEASRVRVGIDVPVNVRHEGATTVVFKSVGGAVDCVASELERGLYKLALSTEYSSLHQGPSSNGDNPTMRSFRASFSALLRDGQTHQHVAGTDPLSGETVKVDVSLSVVK